MNVCETCSMMYENNVMFCYRCGSILHRFSSNQLRLLSPSSYSEGY
ncbi:MAG: hypothetical protein HYT70_01025 [Candidatus Aenigmarchaeota archaeon]|nr:hypothetical protein [Candidatus Aenigmarchaeota archaeon]